MPTRPSSALHRLLLVVLALALLLATSLGVMHRSVHLPGLHAQLAGTAALALSLHHATAHHADSADATPAAKGGLPAFSAPMPTTTVVSTISSHMPQPCPAFRCSCCPSCCPPPPSPGSKARRCGAGSCSSTRAAHPRPAEHLRGPSAPSRPRDGGLAVLRFHRVSSSCLPVSVGTPSASPCFLSPAPPSGHSPPPSMPPPRPKRPAFVRVTVTGNPAGRHRPDRADHALSGDELAAALAVHAGRNARTACPASAAPTSARTRAGPIIRGLDGDRIRILQNGGAAPDASALSYDHAVPVDALVTERIEVLRGPSALLYGGSAVGGVVNVIDNRIPREPHRRLRRPGRCRLCHRQPREERRRGARRRQRPLRAARRCLRPRRSDDVRVPIELDCEKPGVARPRAPHLQLGQRGQGGAVGGSVFFDQRLGRRVGQHLPQRLRHGGRGRRHHRHAVRPLCARRRMARRRGFFTSVHAKLSHTDYRHTEFEGAEAGTAFANHEQRPARSRRGIAGSAASRA